jgi:hypothetical protein
MSPERFAPDDLREWLNRGPEQPGSGEGAEP